MRIMFLALILMGPLIAYPLVQYYGWPPLSLDFIERTLLARTSPTAPLPAPGPEVRKSPTPAFPVLKVPAQPQNPFAPRPREDMSEKTRTALRLVSGLY